MDIGEVDKALRAAGLSITGVSQPPAPHATTGPATFIQVGSGYVRVDWAGAPTPDQENAAADAVKALGIGDVGAVFTSVPRK